jgi:para-aminobenzoate synthetase component 1
LLQINKKNKSKNIKWLNPFKVLEALKNELNDDFCFLFSGQNKEVKKSKSYLGIYPKEKFISENFAETQEKIRKRFINNEKYFGYFSYEIGEEFEGKSLKNNNEIKKSFIDLPKIYLVNFQIIFEFDHQKEVLKVDFENQILFENILKKLKNYQEKESLKKAEKTALEEILEESNLKEADLEVAEINSNFSDNSYKNAITQIKTKIVEGDFYQTNLTRKYFGKFNQKINFEIAFKKFLELSNLNPANYSSFLRLNNKFIISSSPELFLKTSENKIISRPIKGTSPRDLENLAQDQKNKEYLATSEKERAENLMIVDLVRNDLSRVCKAKSVKVAKLFQINSYQNIHHMSSEISGIIAKNFDIFDCFKAIFPAGSMTGAPKIAAMKFVKEKELMERGVYSGAIGYISKDESNLSVVIRTIICENEKFEFQVGGAITFDSNEEMELNEIFSKAKSIANILKITL